MSASVRGMPGGQPSTTQPIAGPWLSPKVVTRNRWPNVLCDISNAEIRFRAGAETKQSGIGMLVAHCLLRRKPEVVRTHHPDRHGMAHDDGIARQSGKKATNAFVNHRLIF